MTVALVIVAKDEADHIGNAIDSTRGLVDAWTVVDTGSQDGTQAIVVDMLSHLPGGLYERQVGEGGLSAVREEALRLAKGTADWLLMIDADMTADLHPGFRDWLDWAPEGEEQDARARDVTAWRVEIQEGRLSWRLPWLMRGDVDWRYEGATHGHLMGDGRRMNLLGLTLHHHGTYDPEKPLRDIDALAAGVQAGDPRSIYYTAWALKALGRTDEAIAMYRRRASMPGTWEEEAWHAEYWAAKLAQDPEQLLACWRRRPWRHEPLTEASRLIAAAGARDDYLFLERHGC